MCNTWDRQPGETSKAFEAFRIYLELRAERTYTKVAERLQKTHPLIARWAIKYHWHKRTLDFDNHEMRQDQKRQVREAAAMRKRQAAVGMKGLEISLARLSSMSPQEINRLPVGTVAKLMEVSTKIERAARGEVSETQALPINVIIGRRPPQNAEEAVIDATIKD
jgi:hypothetical protein